MPTPDPLYPYPTDDDEPNAARFFLDTDANGTMCLWSEDYPGDPHPVSLLREGDLPSVLWDACVRQLVVDDMAVERVAIALHHALDAVVRTVNPPFKTYRHLRIMQAVAAIEAFGGTFARKQAQSRVFTSDSNHSTF